MPSIGTATVTVFIGRLQRAIRRATTFRRVGTDGVGIQYGGWEAPQSEVITIVQGSDVSFAETYRDAARSTIGTYQTVVDQFGVTWPNVLVVNVVTEYAMLITGGVQITSKWTLQPQSVGPN